MKFLRLNIFMIVLLLGTSVTFAQKNKSYQLSSPDGKTVLKIEAGENCNGLLPTIRR
ncbi:MAG TPA: hypothetical protein VGP55_16230 [Chitinophagaceae bacterium]|nr:hypothetical protein [Chitinophagaceae bacterium]